MDRLSELHDKNAALLKDIYDAIGKLKETEEELRRARILYEKNLFAFLKEALRTHPRFSISALVLVIFMLIVGSLSFFKDKNLAVNTENVQLETKIKEKMV